MKNKKSKNKGVISTKLACKDVNSYFFFNPLNRKKARAILLNIFPIMGKIRNKLDEKAVVKISSSFSARPSD